MRLPDLPPVSWTQSALTLIVEPAGRLVRLDESTSLLVKGWFARVAIKIDISKPLVPGTGVELEGVAMPPFWQSFEYEHVRLFCRRCGRVGHRPPECLSPISSPSTQVSDYSLEVEMRLVGSCDVPSLSMSRPLPLSLYFSL